MGSSKNFWLFAFEIDTYRMNQKFIICLLLVFFNVSFSQKTTTNCVAIPIEENKNGKIENHIFSCYKFDWKIKIPENYYLIDVKIDQELKEMDFDALKQMERDGTKIKRNPSSLLSFGINQRNFFYASLESIDKTQPLDLAMHKTFMLRWYNKELSKNVSLTYESSSSLVKIGNYDFYRIYIKIYNAKTNQPLLTKEIYNSFIGTYLFSASINYDNEQTRKELVSSFVNSFNN